MELLAIALGIGVLASVLDYVYHLVVVEGIRSEGMSPFLYFVAKGLSGTVVFLVIHWLFSFAGIVNVAGEIVIFGILSALLFAYMMMKYYPTAGLYKIDLHIAHLFVYIIAYYIFFTYFPQYF